MTVSPILASAQSAKFVRRGHLAGLTLSTAGGSAIFSVAVWRASEPLTGLIDPPCDRNCTHDTFASTASHSNVRDDRDPPLMRDETGEVIRLIWVFSEMESFCSRGWTDSCAARPSGKSACDQLAGRISISVMRHSVRYISSVHISACERDRRVMQGSASARRRSRLLVSRRILPLRLQ